MMQAYIGSRTMIWGVFLICCIVEIIWRRGYALWLAMIAGLMAGFTTSIFPKMNLTWKTQFVLFASLGTIALIIWHYYYRRPVQYFEKYPEERKARDYLYRTFTLSKEMKDGCGQEILDDSIWHLRSDQDFPAGTQVQVKKVRGIFLYIAL